MISLTNHRQVGHELRETCIDHAACMSVLHDDFAMGKTSAVEALGSHCLDAASLAGYYEDFINHSHWQRQAMVNILANPDSPDDRERNSRTTVQQQNLEKLAQAGSVCILSGQQPGLGLGPHFNFYKIAHSILLSKQLNRAGIQAVPVYWCASEDHDLGEANHCDLLTRHGTVRRIMHQFPNPGASLQFQPAYHAVRHLLAAMQELHPTGLGQEWLHQRLPESTEMSFSSWTANTLAELFADHGLLVVQAHELRPLWAGVLPDLIADWPAKQLYARHQINTSHGYANPLADLQEPPLFIDRPEGRQPWSANQHGPLSALDPKLLSPGAGLRPVLQQWAFPGLAYCAGDGEIAYHAQLGPIYSALQVPRPALIPRLRGILQPSWHQRGCQQWRLDGPSLLAGASSPLPPVAIAGIDNLQAAIDQLSASSDPESQQRLQTAQQRLRREIKRLQSSFDRGARRQAQRPPLGHLYQWLQPRERPQERVLSSMQSLWSHGPGFIDTMLQAMDTAAAGSTTWLQP